MGARLFAFTCGTVTGDFARLMEGGQGDVTVPVPVFLIEHSKGRVLFTRGSIQSAGTTLSGGSALGLRSCSGSAFGPARK